ncbi:hypothetical protein GCM10007918_49320 [Piscinibacter gummiphilus]|nr:hypothetical protein GCM10007918_49320 [Piscinibacter gummiphilus]
MTGPTPSGMQRICRCRDSIASRKHAVIPAQAETLSVVPRSGARKSSAMARCPRAEVQCLEVQRRASGKAQGPGLRRDDECFEFVSFSPDSNGRTPGPTVC